MADISAQKITEYTFCVMFLLKNSEGVSILCDRD